MDSIVRIRAGMGDGTGTKAGFIGKIPRETPFSCLKHASDDAAGGCLRGKCTFKNHGKHCRNAADM